ncbi:DNA mismatch repair protein MutS [Roseomonas sp. CCTCC AB2023176]|uniref:DNA mismatch repair protein MutS n=1 Tax=Roseomonas sp. CCTCC AB2023176 TaxID=3342640 RepID=UPI0035DDF7DC
MNVVLPPTPPDLPNPAGATPALAQWFAAKAAHPDAMVFFRMGDFYELFFADAVTGAEALGLALSHRGEHDGQPVPMAGVPAHAMESYLARLIRRGFRVAICEQMETPEQAKARRASAVRREVVRVVTPATVTEEALLEGARPSWLLALAPAEGDRIGAAWLDVSTGAVCTEVLVAAELGALLARLEPAEVLAPPALAQGDALTPLGGVVREEVPPRDAGRRAAEAWGIADLAAFGAFSEAEVAALAMALDYVRGTGAGTLPRLSPPEARGERARSGWMGRRGGRSTSCVPTEGGRARREGLPAGRGGPDADGAGCAGTGGAARLAAGGPGGDRGAARCGGVPRRELAAAGALREQLRGAPDMARALARLSVERFSPRDLAAVRDGLARAEAMRDALAGADAPMLVAQASTALLPDASPRAELARALAKELPARVEDGGVIGAGYDGELDGLRRLRDDARGAILALQMDLAQAWGVASLKIRHHQQLGFLAEVPASAGEKLLREARGPGPMAPIHRQTMANAHRFTCEALASLDKRLSDARDDAARREALVVRHLRTLCLDAAAAIAAAARAMAEIDVHAAGAELAASGGWCRPEMVERPEFRIVAGRHPVVEAALRRARGPAFVPNDCDLSPGQRLCLLTGPNMAGKSTYLRQNALVVILAQSGLFVPAESARIGLVDRLFSRVGTADDIAGGRSTFMVEMTETAAVLNAAGPRSFVVLDEVGRGTATWDGLAIAWAVLEALHDRLRPRTIFATHFHELTGLAAKLPEVAPATMTVREYRGSVVFQHLVAAGASERSWGLHVARLAGVPREVVGRAERVLAALEERARGLDPLAGEMPLFAAPATSAPPPAAGDPLTAAVEALDPDVLSPREALEALYRLKMLLDPRDGVVAAQEKRLSSEG